MNVIICHTPLQVLIAEKIMEKHPNQDFFGIMFTFKSYQNQKFLTYWARLKKQCKRSFLFTYPQTNKWDLFKTLFQAKKEVKSLKVDKLFVASIDDQFVQLMCSTISFNQLETFDDGTANIVPNSFYYQPSAKNFNRKLSHFLLGNRFDTQVLRQLSQKHYTIYPNQKNIIENTEVILLAKNVENQTAYTTKPIKLLLGQPLFNDDKQNIELTTKVIKAFGIDQYLPHPRESYRLDNVKYIETPLIFEDYISHISQTEKYQIYTYFSGAVLNVLNNANIDIVAIRPPLTNPIYLACYDLFEKMKIKIVEFNQ